MRQTVTRRVTGISSQVPVGQRGHLLQYPLDGGGPVFAPPATPPYSHHNHMVRGAWQASEKGRGMGQTSQAGQAAVMGVQSAGAITSGVAASTIASGGTFLGFSSAAVAVPVIGAIVAGVTLALVAIFSRKGPKQKVATTEIVNKVEPLLQQNLEGYMSGPRTKSSQAQAIENFKAGWQYVVDNCDVPVMGNPGQECVKDRQRGGQWDWFAYYHDPIANDTQVIPDPEVGSTVTRNADGTVTVTPPPDVLDKVTAETGIPAPLLVGGLALMAVLMMGGSK